MKKTKVLTPLEKIILYLIWRLARGRTLVGRTRIMKLLYLADLVAKHRLGKTITGSQYYYYFFGPYSNEIQNAIISLTQKGLIVDNPVLTNLGQAHDYKTNILEEPSLPLSEEEKAILEEMIRKFGRRSLENIVKTAYRTPPMQKAKPYDLILSDAH